MIVYLPGVSDRELTDPVGDLTPPGRAAAAVDWLICFVVDSPDGNIISPPPLDSCTYLKKVKG